MKKLKLAKPKCNNKSNKLVTLYAYTREGGGSNYGCNSPPQINNSCTKSTK